MSRKLVFWFSFLMQSVFSFAQFNPEQWKNIKKDDIPDLVEQLIIDSVTIIKISSIDGFPLFEIRGQQDSVCVIANNIPINQCWPSMEPEPIYPDTLGEFVGFEEYFDFKFGNYSYEILLSRASNDYFQGGYGGIMAVHISDSMHRETIHYDRFSGEVIEYSWDSNNEDKEGYKVWFQGNGVSMLFVYDLDEDAVRLNSLSGCLKRRHHYEQGKREMVDLYLECEYIVTLVFDQDGKFINHFRAK